MVGLATPARRATSALETPCSPSGAKARAIAAWLSRARGRGTPATVIRTARLRFHHRDKGRRANACHWADGAPRRGRHPPGMTCIGPEQPPRVLVIGGGIAGQAVCEHLGGRAGQITLVCGEPSLPYDRV